MSILAALTWEYIQNKPLYACILILVVLIPIAELSILYQFGKLIRVLGGKGYRTELLLFIGIIIISRLLLLVYDIVDGNMRPGFISFLRERIVEKVIDNLKSSYDEVDIGDIVTKATKLPWTFENIVHIWFVSFIPIIIAAIVTFVYMFGVDIILATTLILLPIVYIVLCVIVLPRKCTSTSALRDKANNAFMSRVDDILRNLCSILTENTQTKEMDSVKVLSAQYGVLYRKTVDCFLNTHYVSFVFAMGVLVVFLVRSEHLLAKIDIGTFATTAMLILYLMNKTLLSTGHIKDLTFNYGIIKESEHIFATKDNLIIHTNCEQHPLWDGIVLRDVYISFEGRNILTAYTNHFPKNKLSIIKGSNGSGKTTILKLILGHLTPQAGAIMIDGSSVKDAKKRIAYLPQSPVLFTKTLYENIIYGNDIPPSQYEVQVLIDKLGMSSYLPHLSFTVGKNGGNLSGGQRQLTLFLRIICNKKKDIWLLDEPTSALDEHAKNIVMDLINTATDKTIIMVTHDTTLRLS